ncbi:hypothetical protein RRG08_019260 [Elysia crispata]|uniref:Uncharacterized protein n=1 Tax=Elysia crispata TaxID=231223 RepID=A0AAE0YTF4_9GAST|nr:hypothetical protein RRG08_019260 [Elysia crispata]
MRNSQTRQTLVRGYRAGQIEGNKEWKSIEAPTTQYKRRILLITTRLRYNNVFRTSVEEERGEWTRLGPAVLQPGCTPTYQYSWPISIYATKENK